jgi:ATP-dependent protease ClpP protease subunit
MAIEEKIKEAEKQTDRNPSKSQIESGDYQKGKVKIKGLNISIENPKGSIRKGVGKDGKKWESKMLFTYGYFANTRGKDGDPIDVFIGKHPSKRFDVYIIDQVDEKTRAFDEHKVMFGFNNKEDAKQGYLDSFDDTWTGFGSITTLSLNKFKRWLKNDSAIKYPANRLNMSSKRNFKNVAAEDNIKLIELNGEVEEGVTLASLKEQAGDISKFDTLVLDIASHGGSVAEGLEIMVWLNSLSKQNKLIVSLVSANAYSIASIIMLAADQRLISKHGEVMVHNPMLPELKFANADQLEKYAQELRDLESNMYEVYGIFTGLDPQEIKVLMDNETYLSPEEAVEKGFADQVIDMEKKQYTVASNIKKQINMSKTINVLNRVIAMVNKSDFTNQLYYNSEGGSVEIYQADPSTYAEGDRTNIENGEVKLSDGAKLAIVNFEITAIDKSIEEEKVEEEEVEPIVDGDFNTGPAPIKEKSKDAMPGKTVEVVETVKSTKEVVAKATKPIAAAVTRVSKWSSDVVQETFELGTLVEYKPLKPGDTATPVDSGEYELEDGRLVLVDSDGVIQFIKPASGDAPVEVPAEEAPAEVPAEEAAEGDPIKEEIEVEEEVEAAVEEDVEEVIEDAKSKGDEIDPPGETIEEAETETVPFDAAQLVETLARLEGSLNELTSKVEQMGTTNTARFEKIEQFEDVATEAIDVLATNTVTSFKPVSKTKVGEAPSGSIFSQMKQRRGLK